MDIGPPHERQRPRRIIHERTGMLSYHAMALPQCGHALLPERERFPCRTMSTLRKLPAIRPNPKNAIVIRGLYCMRKAPVRGPCILFWRNYGLTQYTSSPVGSPASALQLVAVPVIVITWTVSLSLARTVVWPVVSMMAPR